MTLRVEFEVGFVPNPKFLQFSERLNVLLTEPQALSKLLVVAAAETLMAGIRRRFMAGLPEALKMHVTASPPPIAARVDRALEQNLRDAAEKLTLARTSGVESKIQVAEARMQRLMGTYQRQLTGSTMRARGRRSRHAQLVQAAMEVFKEMTTISAVSAPDLAMIGIGDVQALEQIETPTANRSGQTNSKMKTLWRHLEFGTGVFSTTPDANQRTTFKDSRVPGAWWWGTRRGQGVLVSGSTPIDALQLGNEFATSEDAARFAERVKELLVQTLAG